MINVGADTRLVNFDVSSNGILRGGGGEKMQKTVRSKRFLPTNNSKRKSVRGDETHAQQFERISRYLFIWYQTGKALSQ